MRDKYIWKLSKESLRVLISRCTQLLALIKQLRMGVSANYYGSSYYIVIDCIYLRIRNKTYTRSDGHGDVCVLRIPTVLGQC